MSEMVPDLHGATGPNTNIYHNDRRLRKMPDPQGVTVPNTYNCIQR